MTKLKRYDMDFVSNEEYHELLPIESEDGKWVKYEDVEKVLKRFRIIIGNYKNKGEMK